MVYLSHFGLYEQPFSLTPDTEFFFNNGVYKDSLNTLLIAVRSGEGFLKVTGEVGTGKTMLCRMLLGMLGNDYVTAYIPNPSITPHILRKSLADEIGVCVSPGVDDYDLLKSIYQSLIDHAKSGKKVILCLDEAQAMSEESLEALRLLTNLETEKRKLLQVVLFGQPELNYLLQKSSVRQLKQRITFSVTLERLSLNVLDEYLMHRLQVAGYDGTRLFTKDSVSYLFKVCQGIPRLANVLANKSLMLAFGRGQKMITKKHVKEAANDSGLGGVLNGLWKYMPQLGRRSPQERFWR